MKHYGIKCPEASRLRQRKYEIKRKYGFPSKMLGGGLTLSHRKCGRKGCHCEKDKGHPRWVLTYMVSGKKFVQHIPSADLEEIKLLVAEGKAYKQALNELLSINAQLIALHYKQKRRTTKVKTSCVYKKSHPPKQSG